MRRKANKEKYNGSTLTSFLGHMPPSESVVPQQPKYPMATKDHHESISRHIYNTTEKRDVELSTRRLSDIDGTNGLHDQLESPKKCHLCGKGFTKASYLKRHILSHSSVKPFRCNICNWGFFQQCNLKRHMASHTLENGVAGFKCEHCSANFTTKSVLSVHLRDAHGDKLVTKKEAQRTATFDRVAPTASMSSNIVSSSHQMIMKGPQVSRGGFPPRISVGRGGQVARMGASPAHTSFLTRPHSSPQKIPSSASSALMGVSNVSSPGSVSVNGWSRCSICNKSFLTPANLKQHMLLHPGSKPFRCNFCGMRFAQKINLKKHMVCHVAGNGHPCPHCNINFRTTDDVAQHVLKQHSNLGNIPDLGNTGRNIIPGNSNSASSSISAFKGSNSENGGNDIVDDQEEMEIPPPDLPLPPVNQDHFVIEGNAVTSQSVSIMAVDPPSQMSASPQVNPPSTKGGAYTCSICMESFDKVGFLNKHIIFKHSS